MPDEQPAAEGRDENGTIPGHPQEAGDNESETAAELSNRAAESVARRYDATKENYLGKRDRDGPGLGEPDPDDEERGRPI